MQNVKFLARLFLKLQENGPLLSARPRILGGLILEMSMELC